MARQAADHFLPLVQLAIVVKIAEIPGRVAHQLEKGAGAVLEDTIQGFVEQSPTKRRFPGTVDLDFDQFQKKMNPVVEDALVRNAARPGQRLLHIRGQNQFCRRVSRAAPEMFKRGGF